MLMIKVNLTSIKFEPRDAIHMQKLRDAFLEFLPGNKLASCMQCFKLLSAFIQLNHSKQN